MLVSRRHQGNSVPAPSISTNHVGIDELMRGYPSQTTERRRGLLSMVGDRFGSMLLKNSKNGTRQKLAECTSQWKVGLRSGRVRLRKSLVDLAMEEEARQLLFYCPRSRPWEIWSHAHAHKAGEMITRFGGHPFPPSRIFACFAATIARCETRQGGAGEG